MSHRAAKEALDIHWVANLPVVPYLINHLSSGKVISVPFSLNNVSVVTYRVMHKEKWIYVVRQRKCRRKVS